MVILNRMEITVIFIDFPYSLTPLRHRSFNDTLYYNERLSAVIGHIVETITREVYFRVNDRELFESYKEQVYRLCYFMMKNRSDAEDICQEVFVKVILTDRSEIREVKAWLLRIASNECNTVLRRRRNGWAKELSAYLRSSPYASNPVEDSYDLRETKMEFYKLYSTLPDKVRMVFTLRYVNELTVPEISNVINVPEGTVKSRLNRGLKLLQNMAASQVKEMVGNESTL